MAKNRFPRFGGVALATLIALFSCDGSRAVLEPGPSGGYRVLFIGNSLTYFNDLPGTVAQLAASVDDTIAVQSVAKPNFALIDHANGKSNALEVIRAGGWHYVVLQQGPSALPESRDTLILATRLLDPEIRAVGGRSALLMTWPELERFSVFDDVRLSYQLAADTVGGLFLPAGEAWRAALAADPAVSLYGPDGYHPAELGTYVAALVVYEGITGHDARSLGPEAFVAGRKLPVPEATVRALQRVAHETVARFVSQSGNSNE